MPEHVSIDTSDENIVLTIESWGQLKPLEIFNNAVNNLVNDFEILKKQL